MSVLLSSLSAGISHAQDRPKLTIAAASDLSPLESKFREAFPSAELTFSFAASGVLARHIENGAPFDVFMSASEEFMNQLAKKGRVDKDAIQVYAIGRIGLWSKSGLVRTLRDLEANETRVVAVANPQLAPYGAAAVAALQKSGLLPKLQPKLVYAENIRQAFQFAETGNADAAILSWSLVYDRGGVLIPDDLHHPVRQVAAPVRRKGGNLKLAEGFVQFLLSDAGRAIFAQHGFNLLPGAPSLRRSR
jgi:molybdate transport system substrate-binding protein